MLITSQDQLLLKKILFWPSAVHPLFEYDLNGKNYDQNMTIFDHKLRPKYDLYVKIETINMTIRIH